MRRPTYNYSDTRKLLLANGFGERKGKGSHFVYEHEFFKWLSVTVDAGHKEISANVYMDAIKAIALKRFILQEHYDSKERNKSGLCDDIEGKLEKSTCLQLFSVETQKMKIDGIQIDSEKQALRFVESERERYKKSLKKKD